MRVGCFFPLAVPFNKYSYSLTLFFWSRVCHIYISWWVNALVMILLGCHFTYREESFSVWTCCSSSMSLTVWIKQPQDGCRGRSSSLPRNTEVAEVMLAGWKDWEWYWVCLFSRKPAVLAGFFYLINTKCKGLMCFVVIIMRTLNFVIGSWVILV